MDRELQIRTVNVELLRAGPPHNQLLSPLTQYLGVCGDYGAGIVTLPYEHRTFERRLRYLRYEGDVEESERRSILRNTGVEIARILGAIPGLPGTLSADPNHSDTLIHLRLVLSASELALLPFELAKVPTGPTETTESWLALQTRVPVCITRHIRTVPLEGVRWPTKPRILFIAGDPDPSNIPFDEHRQVLLDAIAPFRYPKTDDPSISSDGRREQYGQLLTILKDASYEEIERECAEGGYTHVHVLTHGAVDKNDEGGAFGLALRKHDGSGVPDVVSGERFVCALCSLASGAIHRPSVVTVASCDSANQESSIKAPGGSFAHTLHQSGIPLVVASQFPLSKTGSISVTRTLYRGLLHGTNPWLFLHQARSELHGRHATESHDWASLVVYEALPSDLPSRLHEVQYRQGRLAINAALQQIDVAIDTKKLEEDNLRPILDGLGIARRRLPFKSPFAMECLGLRASSYKRQAQADFKRALVVLDAGRDASLILDSCYGLLEKSYDAYYDAVRGFLVNQEEPLRREASLHWVLTQMLSLAAILGKDPDEETLEGHWRTAAISAGLYLEHPDRRERAWAHSSLAELWLLTLTRPGKYPPEKYDSIQRAITHAKDLLKLYPNRGAFEIFSTARQFQRYVDWWGHETFDQHLRELGIERGQGWDDGDGGIVATARQIIRTLEPPKRRRKAKKAAKTGGKKTPPAVAKPVPKTGAAPGGAKTAGSGSAKTETRLGKPSYRPAAAADHDGDGPLFSIEMLPAGHGDCLWIEYGDRKTPSRVLIDCGTQSTYKPLRTRAENLAKNDRRFDLFTLTHIDADHIGGAIPFFNKGKDLKLEFGDVWFNGWRHLPSDTLGARQGEIFSTLIQDLNLPWNAWRDEGPIVVKNGELLTHVLPGGMTLTILSPTPDKLRKLGKRWAKELKRHGLTPDSRRDYRRFLSGSRTTSTDVDALAASKFKSDTGAPNGSSIAFLAEFEGKSVLFSGDAHVPVLVSSVKTLLAQRGEKRLKLDALKVSHHASQGNLGNALLHLLDCPRYLVSTNGSHFNHPDNEAIGRILKNGGKSPSLFFNYRTKDNDMWDRDELKARYDYQTHYPETGQMGIVVTV